MWSLVYCGTEPIKTNKSPEDVQLLSENEYVVGRKDCDILFKDDPSISRKHAVLTVTFTDSQVSNPAVLPVLTVKDYSKFGTSVKGSKLNSGTCTLSDGEEIKFGQMNNVYRAKYTPFTVATSSLPSSDKLKLKQYLQKLGGHQVNEWSDACAMLIMGKVAVTVKAVCALASNKPIVTVEYLDKLIEAVESKQLKPDIVSFTPLLPGEDNDELLKPKIERQTLFSGKTFYFCNKSQFGRMKVSVELAGGSALLLESKPRSLSQLTADKAILMYCDPKSQPAWYKDCSTYLTRKQKRYIQDAEIGHAILYCSTNKHCNPAQDAGTKLHEEFSQKLQNTQRQTQASTPQPASATRRVSARSTAAAANTSTSILVPDSQMSAKPSMSDRSMHIAEMLPPPDVTTVFETQKIASRATPGKTQSAKVKLEPSTASPQVKRKSQGNNDSTQANGKRLRTSARNAASTLHTFEPQLVTSTKATLDTAETRLQQTAGDSAHTTQLDSALPRDSALLGDSALPGDSMLEATAQITVGDNSTMPSMPDDSTTNRVTRIGAQEVSDFDMSVVEETQSSTTSRKDNLNQSEIRLPLMDQSETMEESVTDVFDMKNKSTVKSEPACDRLAVKQEPMQNHQLQLMLRDVEEVINSDSSGSPGSDRDSIDGTKRGMTPDDDEDNDRSPKTLKTADDPLIDSQLLTQPVSFSAIEVTSKGATDTCGRGNMKDMDYDANIPIYRGVTMYIPPDIPDETKNLLGDHLSPFTEWISNIHEKYQPTIYSKLSQKSVQGRYLMLNLFSYDRHCSYNSVAVTNLSVLLWQAALTIRSLSPAHVFREKHLISHNLKSVLASLTQSDVATAKATGGLTDPMSVIANLSKSVENGQQAPPPALAFSATMKHLRVGAINTQPSASGTPKHFDVFPLVCTPDYRGVTIVIHLDKPQRIKLYREAIAAIAAQIEETLNIPVYSDAHVVHASMLPILTMASVYEDQDSNNEFVVLEHLITNLIKHNVFLPLEDNKICALVRHLTKTCQGQSCTTCTMSLTTLIAQYHTFIDPVLAFSDLSLDQKNLFHNRYQQSMYAISLKSTKTHLIKTAKTYASMVQQAETTRPSNREYWDWNKMRPCNNAKGFQRLGYFSGTPGYISYLGTHSVEQLTHTVLQATYDTVSVDTVDQYQVYLNACDKDTAKGTGVFILYGLPDPAIYPADGYIYDDPMYTSPLLADIHESRDTFNGLIMSRLEYLEYLLCTDCSPAMYRHKVDLNLARHHAYYIFKLVFGSAAEAVAMFLLFVSLFPESKASLPHCVDAFIHYHDIFKDVAVNTTFRRSSICLWGEARCHKSTVAQISAASLGKVDSVTLSNDMRFAFASLAREICDVPRILFMDDITPEQWRIVDERYRSEMDGNQCSIEAKNKDPITMRIPPIMATSNYRASDHTRNVQTRVQEVHFTNPFSVKTNLMQIALPNMDSTYVRLLSMAYPIQVSLHKTFTTLCKYHTVAGMAKMVGAAERFFISMHEIQTASDVSQADDCLVSDTLLI